MWDDLKGHRAIQALLCLIAGLVLSLGIARFLAPQRWSSLTMGAGSLAALLLAGLVFARGRTAHSVSEGTGKNVGGQSVSNSSLTPAHELEPPSTPELLICLNLVRKKQIEIDDEALSTFVGSLKPPAAERHSGAPPASERSFLRQKDPSGSSGKPSAWFLRSDSSGLQAEYVDVPILLDETSTDRLPFSLRALHDLHLSGRRVRWNEFIHCLLAGKIPQQPFLKAIILCCPLNELMEEARAKIVTSAVIKELSTIQRELRAKFPLYIIITGLESLPGFEEFMILFRKCRSSALSDPLGFPLNDRPASRAEILDRLYKVTGILGAWRPGALKQENQMLQQEVKRQASNEQQIEALRKNSAERKARLYELPRQVRLSCDAIASFCWTVMQPSQHPLDSGPILRGVFFSGLLFTRLGSAVVTGDIRRQRVERLFTWLLTAYRLSNPLENR